MRASSFICRGTYNAGDSAAIDKERIVEGVRKGRPTLIFDSSSRERETDIVVPSQFVTSEIVRLMRKDGGGLICTTMTQAASEKLGLEYTTDTLMGSGKEVFKYLYPNDIPYDEKSAFSITINHRKTFTGISDRDRALTISEFAKLLSRIERLDCKDALAEFGRDFRAPGHVHLLIARRGLVEERKGHTELSTALMILSGLTPTATIVEMLGDDGFSLSYQKAKEYADRNGLHFVEGKEIVQWWTETAGGNPADATHHSDEI